MKIIRSFMKIIFISEETTFHIVCEKNYHHVGKSLLSSDKLKMIPTFLMEKIVSLVKSGEDRIIE